METETTKKCFLLALPAELRDNIYEEVEHTDEDTKITEGRVRPLTQALAATCRQLRHEVPPAADIYVKSKCTSFATTVNGYNFDKIINFCGTLSMASVDQGERRLTIELSLDDLHRFPKVKQLRTWIDFCKQTPAMQSVVRDYEVHFDFEYGTMLGAAYKVRDTVSGLPKVSSSYKGNEDVAGIVQAMDMDVEDEVERLQENAEYVEYDDEYIEDDEDDGNVDTYEL